MFVVRVPACAYYFSHFFYIPLKSDIAIYHDYTSRGRYNSSQVHFQYNIVKYLLFKALIIRHEIKIYNKKNKKIYCILCRQNKKI